MNKFKIPTHELYSNDENEDQKNKREQIEYELDTLIKCEVWHAQLGEVREGQGGGYLVDLAEDASDYFLHPIESIVFLIKPDISFTSFPDVIKYSWSDSPKIVQKNWENELGSKAPKIDDLELFYIFENIEEAKKWRKELWERDEEE